MSLDIKLSIAASDDDKNGLSLPETVCILLVDWKMKGGRDMILMRQLKRRVSNAIGC